MKQLYLIRHSYAENTRVGSTDFDRHLTPIGKDLLNDKIGLLANLPKPETCIVSSAVRTKETFDFLNTLWSLKVENVFFSERLYMADALGYKQLIEQTSYEVDRLAIIGHNPSITYLANNFCPEFVSGFSPGNILLRKSNADSWNQPGVKWEMTTLL